MPDENPEMTFPSIPPRKPRKRKPAAAKPAARSATVAAAKPPSPKDPRVNEYLTNIYKDKNGRLPDMQHIAIRKNGSWLRSLTTFIIVLALFVGIGWYGYFWWSGKFNAGQSQASIALSGPTSVMLGATTTYAVTVQNTSDTIIPQATVQIYYPAGFIFGDSSLPARNAGHNEWELGTLQPHTKKSITISGQNFGAVQTSGSWRAFLTYQPENFNSTLQESTALNTSIDTSPFELSMVGPSSLVPGASTQLVFTLKNTSSWQPAKLYLTPVVPDNFVIGSTTPNLDSNKRWVVTPSTSTASGAQVRTFTVRGILTKSVDDTVPFAAALTLPMGSTSQLYDIAKTAISSAVSKNGLAFNIAINGNIRDGYTHPGDTLAVTVQAKNTGISDVKNAVIKVSFDAPSIKNQSMLGWADLTDKNNGAVKGEQISSVVRRGTIVWTSKEIPALAKLKPNDEVDIDVALPIKNGQNFDLSLLSPSSTIGVASTLSYTDASSTAKTTNGNPITLSLNSDTSISVQDTASANKHSVTWILNNSLHTLKDIVVSATAFGDITYTNTSTPDGGTLTYDEAHKTITWRIEAMPDSVDVLSAPFSITLNKIDKSQNLLIDSVHLTATDAVTGQPIDIKGDTVPLK